MLILLFKLLTIMDRYPYHRPTWFINAMKPYVMDIMESQNQFEDITSTLTAYDHYALLSYFENNPNKVAEIEWLYYAYMMIVEKSGHLKQQYEFCYTFPFIRRCMIYLTNVLTNKNVFSP